MSDYLNRAKKGCVPPSASRWDKETEAERHSRFYERQGTTFGAKKRNYVVKVKGKVKKDGSI